MILDVDAYNKGELYKDHRNRNIDTILVKNILDKTKNKWIRYSDPNNVIYIWNGLLTIDHKLCGEFNIVVLYRYDAEAKLTNVSNIKEKNNSRPYNEFINQIVDQHTQ